MENYMKLEISALGVNESFARSAVAAFALALNPSLNELSDIKTAVSEAVTNCIVHAYEKKDKNNKIIIECTANQADETLHICVRDFGRGIEDLETAMLPFYTTLENEERSGLGFTIMQTFMTNFSVKSERGEGTCVSMLKKIGLTPEQEGKIGDA